MSTGVWYPANSEANLLNNKLSTYSAQGAMYTSDYRLCAPLMIGTQSGAYIAGTGIMFSPEGDATTGAQIPPAIPVRIESEGGLNAGGYMKGIYNSCQVQDYTYLDTLRVKEGIYTINGSKFMCVNRGTYRTNANMKQDLFWIHV